MARLSLFPVSLCRDEGDKATLDDQLYCNNSMNESWTKKLMRVNKTVIK